MSNDYGRSSFGHSRGRGGSRGSPRERGSYRRHFDSPERDTDRYRERRPSPRDGGRNPVEPRPAPAASPSVRGRGKSATNPSGAEHRDPAAAIKSSPVAPSPRSLPTPSGPLRPDVRKATEFLCERLFWYMKRDTADKKLQKLQSDVDRCQPCLPEFGSAAELLKQQKDLAAEERAKCCSRLDAADEKLQSALQQLVARSQQSKPEDIIRPPPGHGRSETPAPDLEARFSAAQRSAEASFTRTLARESSMIKESLRTEFEAKTAELRAQTVQLKAQLYVEQSEKAEMKRRLDALEHRVNDSANQQSLRDQAQVQNEEALAWEAKIKEETKGLVSRDELDKALQALDKTMSLAEQGVEDDESRGRQPAPGAKTAHKLRHLASVLRQVESSLQEHDVGQMAQRIQQLRTEVDGSTEAIKQQTGRQLEARAAMQTLESSLAKLSAADAAKTAGGTAGGASAVGVFSASDSHIQQVSLKVVEDALRKVLPMVQTRLQDYLKQEKVRGDCVAKEAGKTADAAAALRTDLEKLGQEWSKSRQELGIQVAQTHADLVAAWRRIETLESTCPAARAETKTEADELAMQVRDLKSWQNNFTTRPLYKDIVDHINATLPNGTLNQLRSLVARVTALERHLHAAQGGDAKKRKIESPAAPSDSRPGSEGRAM